MGVKGALSDGLEESHLERKTSKNLRFIVFLCCGWFFWTPWASLGRPREAEGRLSGPKGIPKMLILQKEHFLKTAGLQ